MLGKVHTRNALVSRREHLIKEEQEDVCVSSVIGIINGSKPKVVENFVQ